MNHQFPQALPGEGILSRFTRPSFLQWTDKPKGTTRALFGDELSTRVTRLIEHYGLQHAGFVARPLYTCTRRLKGGDMCMKVASMSKFIQQHDERTHYRCTKCRQEESAASTPVSDSVPLRVLELYILVRDGSNTTFMHSKAYRLCLRTPPPQWAWGVDLGELPPSGSGHP